MEEIKINLDNLTAEEREQFMKLVKKGNLEHYPSDRNPGFLMSGLALPKSGEAYDQSRREAMYRLGLWGESESGVNEAVKTLEMQTKWKRLSIEAGEEENPWDGKKCHWHCYTDVCGGELHFSFAALYRANGIYFPTEASLKAAIAELGEDNVKKYILNVKE